MRLRFLLDTNVLSEAGKKRPHPKVLNWLLAHEFVSGVPSVVIAERYKGAHGALPERRVRLLAEVDHFVQTLFWLALILTFSPKRRNSHSPFFVLRMTVRQIQSPEFPVRRRTILPLPSDGRWPP